MRAFVIRPFRAASGIDFMQVHKLLIAPALEQAGYAGGTTEAIIESGIIHESMFLELVDADLVVADVSVHNANVFYELGIRHALRPSATVLLRAQPDASGEVVHRAEIPFDIQGVRYFSYDRHDLKSGVGELAAAIRETAAVRATDSPVFRLLPDLVVDAARLQTVPADLQEQIEVHRSNASPGDLRLLAEDVVGLRFEERALRLIASAQAAVGDRHGARECWENIRARRPNDFQANHQLATILARSDQHARSEQAIDRALRSPALGNYQRAELLALRGSNLKDQWHGAWKKLSGSDRERAALRSPQLDEAIAAYTSGFRCSLDNYYAGLNALALTSIQLQLIEVHANIWQTNHWNEETAQLRREEVRRLREWLLAAVRTSLDNSADVYRREGKADQWLNSSIADYEMISFASEERVIAAYERAAQGLSAGSKASVVRQLEYCSALGFRADLAEAIIDGLNIDKDHPPNPPRVVVFRGHMIDADDEPERFPPALEPAVRAAIDSWIREQKKRHSLLVGFAGAADGGDILFHECCHELDVPTEVFLPVPDRQYRATAVRASGSGTTWLHRYVNVLERSVRGKVHTLNPAVGLPSWVDLRRDASSWPRTNRWILHHAFARTEDVTLLALWDGQPSRGPGGVSHMVELAQARGADINIIDIRRVGRIDGDPGP
jgi:hypothetical protein